MPFLPRIVLHSPVVDATRLEPFVEQRLRDGVSLVAVVGEGAEALEEEIDWIVIEGGSDPDRFLVTSSHPIEGLEEVLEFAAGWRCAGGDGVEQVRL